MKFNMLLNLNQIIVMYKYGYNYGMKCALFKKEEK